jgi:hypothetical protein
MTLFVAQLMLVACQDDPAGATIPECALGSPVRNALQMAVRDCPSQADPDACARRFMSGPPMPSATGEGLSRSLVPGSAVAKTDARPLCRPPYHVSARDGCQR